MGNDSRRRPGWPALRAWRRFEEPVEHAAQAAARFGDHGLPFQQGLLSATEAPEVAGRFLVRSHAAGQSSMARLSMRRRVWVLVPRASGFESRFGERVGVVGRVGERGGVGQGAAGGGQGRLQERRSRARQGKQKEDAGEGGEEGEDGEKDGTVRLGPAHPDPRSRGRRGKSVLPSEYRAEKGAEGQQARPGSRGRSRRCCAPARRPVRPPARPRRDPGALAFQNRRATTSQRPSRRTMAAIPVSIRMLSGWFFDELEPNWPPAGFDRRDRRGQRRQGRCRRDGRPPWAARPWTRANLDRLSPTVPRNSSMILSPPKPMVRPTTTSSASSTATNLLR
jgi:hypothetical protein